MEYIAFGTSFSIILSSCSLLVLTPQSLSAQYLLNTWVQIPAGPGILSVDLLSLSFDITNHHISLPTVCLSQLHLVQELYM